MQHFPIFLNLQGRDCLVVGGGTVAEHKVALLLRTGAKVSVVAPELCQGLAALKGSGRIVHRAAVFSPALIDRQTLVIAACNDRNVNRQVSERAQRRNIPINVVDDPQLCTFIVPAMIDREPITVAISSGGAAPALAKLLRIRLERLIPPSYGRLAALAGGFRERVKRRLPTFEARRRFWEDVFTGPVAERVALGDDETASVLLERQLALAAPSAGQLPGIPEQTDYHQQ